MNSRQRFLAVLDGKMPDRVPVTLFIVDQGHFINQVYPNVDPEDFETLHLKVLEIQRQLGVDVFVRMCYGLNDPLSIHMGGLNVSRQTDNWEVHTEQSRQGNTTIQRSTIRTPDGVLTQEFSRNELRPGTFVYACTKKPIKTPADLEIAVRHEPGMPESFRQNAKKRVQRIKAALGDDGIVGSWSPHGPFNNASLLIDHQELYSLFLTDYAFYERLMTFAMNRILDYARAMEQAGVDIQCVGGNVPGGFLGRRTYDRYILPFERKYIAFLQENGTPAMYHNCGEIMNLVESYQELGVRVVEPFSPPPLGDADLARAKALVDGRYAILSGIDQVNVLQKGSVDQVKRATEQAIRTGKPGGGFILQPVDFLEYGTPLENVEAYVATALAHAAY
jgi:uroporphyrinogen-III decarboxylase